MLSVQKILRVSLAFSMVVCSLSILIYTIKLNPAHAAPPAPQSSGPVPIGIIHRELQQDGTPGFLIHVIGYDAMEKKIKVLEKEWVRR